MKRKNEKDHRAKKSPGSVELFNKLRKERNQARPKQRWVGGESVQAGGRWTRESESQ